MPSAPGRLRRSARVVMLLRTVRLALILVLVCSVSATAQQVGDNVNVLPVYKTVNCTRDPVTKAVTCRWVGASDDALRAEDALRGNLYGQRLNEPSILVSSRNKDHIMVFFNDYRAVDLAVDQPIPGTVRNSVFASLWKGVRTFFARLAGTPAGMRQPAEKDHATFSQAGVGCSVSYDGGLTWTGCMVPGLPSVDLSPASKASPSYARGLQGMSDPTAASGKCGRGYLANIAFTYGQGSQMQVHTVQDMNDSDVLHTWEWKGIAALADCNNSSWGCFVDKPAIATRLLATDACDGVTEYVYATYTTFTGTTGTGSTRFQSKVNLATSTDGGRTFTSQLVDGNYTQVQGTDVEVTPAGTVYVFFRSFNSPNSIVMRKSSAKGSGWEKPVDIVAAGDPSRPTLQAFDQPTIDLATGGPTSLAFRSNAFPAAAMTPDGKVLIVTFQEKAGPSGLPCGIVNGVPEACTPRIMMTFSTDGGTNWSPRRALSYSDNRGEPRGLGYFSPDPAPAGPQVQPAIACSTDTSCLVTWMESKETDLSASGWIAGYDRRVNHRALALQVGRDSTGNVTGVTASPSVQVSRYSYDDDTEAATDADSEVEQIRQPGLSTPMWNFLNFNNYDTGRSPFAGDYTDVRALTPDTFITAFTDNRYVVPPATYKAPDGSYFVSPDTPWLNFPNYTPYPQCPENNPGSRAQTVMAAQISSGLIVTTPANFKAFNTTTAPVACGAAFDGASGTWGPPTRPCLEFPFTAWNNTAGEKRYKIWLSSSAPEDKTPSFAKDHSPKPPADPEYYALPLTVGGLSIYPFSSNSANVYVFDGSPVTVNIAECTGEGESRCAAVGPVKASVTFNAPTSAPLSVATQGFAYAPSAVSVSGRNVSGRNVSGRNVSGRNVSGRNVSGRNTLPPDPITGVTPTVYKVVDYSVQVAPTTSDDVGTYLSLFNVDEAYADDYVFQVLVTKPLTSFTSWSSVAGGCGEPFNATDGSLVGQAFVSGRNVSGRNVSGRNVSGRNVSGRNPVPVDADPIGQTIQNTSFTLGSSTAEYLPLPSGSGSGSQPPSCPGVWGRIGDCTLAAPRLPNTVTITLRAFQVTEHPVREYNPEIAPPSLAVAEYSCKSDACLYESGPDLAVPEPPVDPSNPANVSPADVRAGSDIRFPTAAVKIDNIGKDCGNGDPCGTAQAHRWGIYLSEATTAGSLPRYQRGDSCPSGDPTQCVPGMIKENRTDFGQPITILAAVPAELLAGLKAGESEYVEPQAVRVPTDIPLRYTAGTVFYAYLYIDDQRIVSELNEENNIVQGGPIVVRAPGLAFLGLQTPCSGMTCDKTGTLPLAWQFTAGSTPVDSASALPRAKFWTGCPYATRDAAGYPYPYDSWVASSSPDPADITSGKSGWQYFPYPGMSRPQYTWQVNFDATGLPRGVCYTMWIEVPSTGQTVPPADPALRPFGPFYITPR